MSPEDFHHGYCMSGVLERRQRRHGTYHVTHTALVRRGRRTGNIARKEEEDKEPGSGFALFRRVTGGGNTAALFRRVRGGGHCGGGIGATLFHQVRGGGRDDCGSIGDPRLFRRVKREVNYDGVGATVFRRVTGEGSRRIGAAKLFRWVRGGEGSGGTGATLFHRIGRKEDPPVTDAGGALFRRVRDACERLYYGWWWRRRNWEECKE